MLRIIESKGAGRAKSYFTEGLNREDYYTDGQEIAGRWGGRGAELLNLSGQVEREAFAAMCDNIRPDTGERLTAVMNDRRRVGYDFNFHVPKSVSAMYELTGDERILTAFRDSVRETMQDIEADMQTRVRKGGKDENRTTGNIVYGEFIHRTARPVDGGLPDPHLHAHCFVFNATYDAAEQQWKAGQFGDIKRDAPYYEAGFHSRMAGKVAAMGYGIHRTAKGWEIAGVPQSVIDKFSNRTAEIEAEAKKRGITNAKEKDQLGAKTRSRKRKDMGMGELRQEWAGRLSVAERAALRVAAGGWANGSLKLTDKDAMDYAVAHAFERQSVVSERELMTQALRHGVGTVTVDGVRREAARGDVLARDVAGRRMVTTQDVLAEEKAMIDVVKRGRGKCEPMGYRSFVFTDERLNAEQRAAVMHVLRSRDVVTGIRGGAGTGKTTLMREAIRGIEQNGKQVFTFAPTADASRGVLRGEGFENADTVAALLSNPELQEKIKFQVIWIDEAGLVGAKTMAQVLKLAERHTARVVISGDIGQHNSVERGDAMRLLETHAGLKVARVSEIQRQKGTYKQAVAAIEKGNLDEGFAKLEAMGAIVEAPDDKRYGMLAGEYVQAVKAGKSVQVVAPTHAEGARVTDAVRAELKAAGKLKQAETPFIKLENLQWTEPQRADARHYQPGMVVQFTRAAEGIKRGERFKVSAVKPHGEVEVVSRFGFTTTLPLAQAGRFQVYREKSISLAVGDKVRITQNGFGVGKDNKLHLTKYGLKLKGKERGPRLDNGALHEVAGFTVGGDIRLRNGWVVGKEYGHLAYGYCSTSYSSQGKTVDRVLIAQTAASWLAASREQFYVAASRGREWVRIFTDDKQALREAVDSSLARMSATELTQQGSKPARTLAASPARRQTELLRQLQNLARIHAARAVEAVKDAAKEIGGPQKWVERVRPQRAREMEFE